VTRCPDALLRRVVRITHTESPINPPTTAITVHLTAHRWVPRRLVIAVGRGWFSTPVRLLLAERSLVAGADTRWALHFEKTPVRP